MKKTFTFFLMLVAGIGTICASNTSVDGIWYNFESSKLTAEVTYRGSSYYSYSDEYSGAVIIPASVTYSGKTYSVTSIGEDAFSDCTGLTSVTIPNSVTSIGGASFFGCNSLGSIEIPNNVISIGDWAFEDCIGLTSVTIPNSVTSIGEDAFSGCTSLPIIDNLRYADTYLVEATNKSLATYSIKSTTRWIGGAAFSGCNSLASIEIPNNVISIGDEAFEDCIGLTSVTIPNSVTSIGNYAFYGCTSLLSINVATNNSNYSSEDGVLFNKDETTLIQYPGGKHGEYHIPNSVTIIGVCAFYKCNGLTSVTIPNSAISVGNAAFNKCSNLTSVTIGNSITSIGSSAFDGCSNIKEVTLNSNAIVSANFTYSSSLKDIFGEQVEAYQIGDEVTSIGNYAFNGCSRLISIVIAKNVASIGLYAFNGCTSLIDIYATCGDLERVKKLFNNDSRVKYKPLKYQITILAAENGVITYPEAVDCDTILTAIPDYGYHFTQWSDGNTDNPRIIELTQDTTFSAEFTLNKYSVSVTCDNTRGSIVGESGEFDYLSELTYIAIPNHGYHLDYWRCRNNPYSDYKLLWDYSESAPDSNPDNGLYYESKVNDSNLKGIKLNSSGYCYFTKQAVSGILELTYSPRSNGENSSLKIETWQGASASSTKPTSRTLITTTQEVTELTTVSVELTETQNNIFIERLAQKETVLQKIQFTPLYTKDTLKYKVEAKDTIEAVFVPNMYTLQALVTDTFGTISGAGTFAYQTECILNVTPNYGYHFTQWSDGNTENPRTIILTQDTTFTAEIAVNTSGQCGDELYWSLADSILTIVGTGDMWNEQPWVASYKAIKEVVLPKGITSIGTGAFNGCTGLTSIEIPNSVTSIGEYAFWDCTGLTSVIWRAKNCNDFSSGNTPFCYYIYERVFYDIREQITSFVFGDEVEHIPAYLCDGMSQLSNITIPNSVTSIGNGAFKGCIGLTSVEIPNGVTSIGNSTFSNCSGLTSVSIPKSVTSIGNSAFYYCTGLTSVTIGNSVTSIGNFAFFHCTGLTSVTIGNSVTSIGNSAFSSCSGLTSVNIPNSVTSIGEYAFSYCMGVTSIDIPNSVTQIGNNAFENVCNIVYSGTAEGSPWGARSINGYIEGYLVYSDNTKTNLLACRSTATGDIIIPNSVTSIGENAFYACQGLTSLTIGSGVTSIGDYAFYACQGLTSLTIGSGVTSIGDYAFYGCTGFPSIFIPYSVKSIGNNAFGFVANIVYYGTATGAPWGARSINGYVDGYLVYSDDTKTNLLACSSAATGEIIVPNSVTSIGEYAFAFCTSLTSIEIPNSTTNIRIGDWAFVNCIGMTSITIGNSVTSIGNYAFSGCENLKKIINHRKNPANVYSSSFNGVDKLSCTLYVPWVSIDTYRNAAVWGDFYNIEAMEIITDIEEVEDSTKDVTKETIKILRNGNVYILRGEKVYTVTGQEVR